MIAPTETLPPLRITGWPSVARLIADAWRPPDELKPWQWIDRHVVVDNTSQFQGQPQTEVAPWTREVIECMADDSVRQINIMCCSQGSKTQTLCAFVCWVIDNAPGPLLFFTSTQEERKNFSKTRMWPTLEKCLAIADKLPDKEASRSARTMFEINFMHMTLGLYAANSIASVRGKPARWLFLDEVTAWTNEAAFPEVLRRVGAWDNARTVVISTPKLWEDNVHEGYLHGDRREYYVPCMGCPEKWPLVMKQLRYDTNEETRPRGEDWNFDALAKTIRYECPACGHKHYDTPVVRRHFANHGEWRATNPAAPKHHVSFHWNALLVWWKPWRKLVEDFVRANDAKKRGNIEPLKAFITHELGEPFQHNAGDEDFAMPCGSYKMGDKWPQAAYTFFTIDVQKDHFWVVIRSWAMTGASRLIYFGKVNTEDELVELQKRFSIKSGNVAVDYGNFWTRVARMCAKYGWRMLRGQDRQGFTHGTKAGKKLTRVYSQKIIVDAYLGTRHQGQPSGYVILYDWSVPLVKDTTFNLSTGKGAMWEIPEDIPPTYIEHVYKSESKVMTRDKRTGKVKWMWVNEAGRPNHGWDCENENTVMAFRAKLLGRAIDDDEPAEIAAEKTEAVAEKSATETAADSENG